MQLGMTKNIGGYSKRERAEMIQKMQHVSNQFYSGAVRTGCHAFVEFTGLINEFIKLCEEVEDEGGDFTNANVHSGAHLPFQEHHLNYLSEKLECIYGVKFMGAKELEKDHTA